MPNYEYLCKNCGHRFEQIRKFSDKPLRKCPECGGVIEQVISAPAVQFKGSGWYVTDYAKKGAGSAGSSSASSSEATAERKKRRTPKKRKTRRTQRMRRKTTSPSLTLRKSTRKTNSSRPHFTGSARPSEFRQSVLVCRQQRFVGVAVHRQIFPSGIAG